MRRKIWSSLWGAALIGALALPARSHETDPFTLPEGRTFADIGSYLNEWAFRAIEQGVRRVNQRIAQGPSRAAATVPELNLEASEEIIRAVNASFGNAYEVIEGLERELYSTALRQRYPGMVVGYKQQFGNIYQHVHFVLDPRQVFRLWHASTFLAYGTYIGTDKIGHFTDMGMNYYRAYASSLRKGKDEAEAVAAAVEVGTSGPLFSERGMVGYLSAGHYSNADLAANYIGFLFYRNLTEPMMIEGTQHQPMLVREGAYWKIAPHVGPNSDFFSAFISDHYDEALNPGLYEKAMRDKVHDAISERATAVLNRRIDHRGNRRPRSYFLGLQDQLKTYYGADYGQEGTNEELMSVAGACYETFSADASPAARNRFGMTPLHEAATMGEVDRVRDLIRRGADVNALVRSDESYSPEWGNTPLHYAAAEGRTNVVQSLLDAGANAHAANDRGQTALHRAVNHPDVVQLLIERDAPVNAQTVSGESPLHWAAADGQRQVVELLLNNGANARLRSHSGETPLHAAARANDAELTLKLLTFGSDANAVAALGMTPLHIASQHDNQAVADVLIQHGAGVNLADQFGWTPLHAAADVGATTIAEALIRKGANVNAAAAHENTALHIAVRKGRTALAELLLARQANVNAVNRQGMMPLHIAVATEDASSVATLLKFGADRFAKNHKGIAPLQMTKSPEITTLLRTTSGPGGERSQGAPGSVRSAQPNVAGGAR